MLKQENEKELSQNTTPNQEQKIDYTKYVPYEEYSDKILGPVSEESVKIQEQIENLVDDLTDLIRQNMFKSAGEQKPLEDIPLKRLAQKGVLPDHLGKTTRKRDKIDEDFARYCRESNEKIPVAPLTFKEKELLQQTLNAKGLSENDFAIMSMRHVLGAAQSATRLHDDRRPLPL